MRPLPLLLLLVACGGRDPTSLADMGPVDVSVGYALMSASGPGAVDVTLTAAEGCPTFIGEGTFNGVALTVEEPGHSEAGGYYFIPTERCFTPALGEGAPRGIGADEALDVVLSDDSDTWAITHPDPFTMRYTAPEGTIRVGDALPFTWDGPSPSHVFVQAWQEDLGLWFPYEVADDGGFVATVSDDVRPGTVRVVVESYVQYTPEGCDGPASCQVWVDYGAVFDLLVEG